ncbi:hypothetical protein M758_8G018300 [Ceratodon purpureus]|uniref:Sulfhydryl oxidase n=1 Tax=Ceratodon purpureus TaxID=3225 RepID=A0A8T0GZT0_CERPU|nr:hypothetical protein KC19_8G018900 [Ceratodon purpureus]KAG0607307.1 hypothetical protein M758_8G018300 [Ceratodon purpureus]
MAGEGYGVGMWVGIMLILGGIVSVHGVQDECTVELYDMIFRPTLSQIKTPHAIVEFYASWMSSCQEYAPHYDRVACLFNWPHAVHGDEVYVVKVDCAIESNKGICARFDIKSYPTLYWGAPEALAIGGAFAPANAGLESVDGKAVSTDEDLLQWINTRINKQYSLTDKKPEDKILEIAREKHTPTAKSGVWKLPATLHDVEEATAYAFTYMMDERMMRSTSRGSFIQFLHLLERHHPSEGCRKGSAKILENLADWWPIRQAPANILREQKLCGPGLPRGYWDTCDGEGRGYGCGLWMLFHTLTVRVEDFEGSFAITAIEAFVDDFYKCDHCRAHFRNITNRNQHDSTSTKKDVVLWLWRTHNQVTEIVAREESKRLGHSPRKLWPPEDECPACRDSPNVDSDWDDETVYIFLMEFYGLKGGEAATTFHRAKRVTKNNTVGMPYWAVLGMVMASCGFVVAICYSRVKKLKFKSLSRRF